MIAETLFTERLLLPRWDVGVKEDWVALYADPRVSSRLGTGAPIESKDSEAEFDWMLEHWDKHGFGWRSVIERSTGTWIGAVGLNHIGENPTGLPPDDIETGWWLKPEHWGRGFATEAAAASLDEGFEQNLADHVWARHTVRNPASGRIMEKIGMNFVREGAGVAGVPMHVYEITRERWLDLRKTTSRTT